MIIIIGEIVVFWDQIKASSFPFFALLTVRAVRWTLPIEARIYWVPPCLPPPPPLLSSPLLSSPPLTRVATWRPHSPQWQWPTIPSIITTIFSIPSFLFFPSLSLSLSSDYQLVVNHQINHNYNCIETVRVSNPSLFDENYWSSFSTFPSHRVYPHTGLRLHTLGRPRCSNRLLLGRIDSETADSPVSWRQVACQV